MTQPATAIDTFYGTPFPTYDEFDKFVMYDLQARNPQQGLPTMNWWCELGPNNHAHLKRIFESRVDPTVVRNAGIEIDERGGMQAMVANFYMYCHFVGERLKDMGVTGEQFGKLHRNHAKCIEELWDGIGGWRY